MSNISQPESYSQRLIIPLLTAAIRVRKAGLIFLSAFFLINCYFMLFDQATYIVFLEHYVSPDGNITTINHDFERIIKLLFYLCFAWIILTNQSTLESLKATAHGIHWKKKNSRYIIACTIWLLASYLPFLFLNLETIKMLSVEDSFYENSGFLWFLLTSISFLFLFFRGERNQQMPTLKVQRNIFFLLLGILFFLGAGEEISWGQRIFQFKTPAMTASNVQHEFNYHNMPTIYIKNSETSRLLSTSSLFGYFWFSFCIIIPALNITSNNIHRWLQNTRFPIPPIWIGSFFIANSFIYGELLQHVVPYPIGWPLVEIQEAAYSFFFFILSLWFINSHSNRHFNH